MYSKESIFRRPQLSRLFDVDEETIRRDLDKGYITPTQRGGKGVPHLFVWDDLIRIALFYDLRKSGLQPNNAAKLIKLADQDLYEVENEHKDCLVFYMDEPQSVASYSYLEEELQIFKKPIRRAFIIDAKKLINELEAKIKEL